MSEVCIDLLLPLRFGTQREFDYIRDVQFFIVCNNTELKGLKLGGLLGRSSQVVCD